MRIRSLSNTTAFAVILLLLFSALFACSDSAEEMYINSVRQHRAMINQDFLSEDHSPLTPDARAVFAGLPFFEIDPAFCVTAQVQPITTGETIEMVTSSGKPRAYLKFAVAQFELNGQAEELTLYRSIRDSTGTEPLFVPFTDYTNGSETYGGGRYLDVDVPENGTVELDFNLCYNPYCAYSDGWSCPVPPRENALEMPVKAGVKHLADDTH